tara:strand:- start:222 stop:452 length:231 start_codon:yes stop_codon:yes gene_type:complete
MIRAARFSINWFFHSKRWTCQVPSKTSRTSTEVVRTVAQNVGRKRLVISSFAPGEALRQRLKTVLSALCLNCCAIS